jgi:hypothetical protein
MKLKYNTSAVTSTLQKQHQSMWKCSTKKNTLTDLNLRLFWPWYKCTQFKQEVQFTSSQSIDLKCALHFNISAVYWASSNPQTLKIHKTCIPWNATWSPCNPIQNSCDGSTHCHFVQTHMMVHMSFCACMLTYENDHLQNNYKGHTRGHEHCWISNKCKALLQCMMTSFICCLTSEWNAVW